MSPLPDPSPTLGQLLKQFTGANGVSQLDAEVILSHVLQRPRSYLYAWSEHRPTPAETAACQALIQRRLDGEPVAYLTGHREFWSLTLRVTSDTLIPRPETECLVERVLHHLQAFEQAIVADLGTGSGAIAAAIASERPTDRVIATDRSAAALAVAAANFHTLGLRNIESREGEWTAALPAGLRCHLIASNPPYVAAGDPHLAQDGLPWEPEAALVSGDDGLQDLRRLIGSVTAYLKPSGWLVVEHGSDQGQQVRQLFAKAGYRAINTHSDLAGHDRLTEGQRAIEVCRSQRPEGDFLS